jgi:hypothetical protein
VTFTTTGEFDPGLYKRPRPNALFFDGGNIWLIGGGDSNGSMWQTYLDLGADPGAEIESGSPLSRSGWKSQRLSVPGTDPKTVGRCSLVNLAGQLVLLWNQLEMTVAPLGMNGHLFATTSSSLSGGLSGWNEALTVTNADASELVLDSGSDVAATAFPNGTVIVAAIAGGNALLLGLSAAGVSQLRSEWVADWVLPITKAQLAPCRVGVLRPTPVKLGTTISAEWFATGPGEHATYYLWVFMQPEWGGDALALYFFVPFEQTGRPGTLPSPLLTYAFAKPLSPWASSPVFLARDPAGRVVAYFTCGADSKTPQVPGARNLIGAVPLSTYRDPTSLPQPLPITPPSSAYRNAPSADAVAPSACFVPGAPSSQDNDSSQCPWYEVVCYGTNVRFQITRYGTSVAWPNYRIATQERLVVDGYVEGPIPLPKENIVGVTFQDTMPSLGNVVYGSSTTQSGEYSLEQTGAIGLKSEGHMNEGAVGLAWEAMLKFTHAREWTSGTQYTTAARKVQASTIDVGENQVVQSADQILPYGLIFVSTVTVQTTPLQFADALGGLISDGLTGSDSDSAPKYALVADHVSGFSGPAVLRAVGSGRRGARVIFTRPHQRAHGHSRVRC